MRTTPHQSQSFVVPPSPFSRGTAHAETHTQRERERDWSRAQCQQHLFQDKGIRTFGLHHQDLRCSSFWVPNLGLFRVPGRVSALAKCFWCQCFGVIFSADCVSLAFMTSILFAAAANSHSPPLHNRSVKDPDTDSQDLMQIHP